MVMTMTMKKILLVTSLTMTLLISACGASTQPAKSATEPVSTEAPVQLTEASINSEFFLEFANIKGKVEVRATSNSEFTPAKIGQRIGEGTEIRTGADGIAGLYRDSLTLIIVDNDTEIQVKTLQGTQEVPITVMLLSHGTAVLSHHAEKLPEGAIFAFETSDGDTVSIIGSTVMFKINAGGDLKIIPLEGERIVTTLEGDAKYEHGEKSQTLHGGQSITTEGSNPLPNSPSEMTTEQTNEFINMGSRIAGREIEIEDIKDGGFADIVPPPSDLPEIKQGEGDEATQEPNTTDAPDGSDNNDNSGGEDSGDGG